MAFWKDEEIKFLIENYPQKGLRYCAKTLDRPNASIRHKASVLKLKQDQTSVFFKEWQLRAALTKVGKKRPGQAAVILKTHADKKLIKTDAQRKAVGVRVKKWIAENGHPKGFLGGKHTKESLLIMSERSKENWKKLTEEEKIRKTQRMMRTRMQKGILAMPRNGVTWKGGWREIGDIKKYYRSRWEANYARYLQWLKTKGLLKNWEHEPQTFWFEGIKRGSVTYLPDFRVTNNDDSIEFHEVKGWMDSRSLTKIKRMGKYFPEIKLIVIAKKEYKEIEKKVSALLDGWE